MIRKLRIYHKRVAIIGGVLLLTFGASALGLMRLAHPETVLGTPDRDAQPRTTVKTIKPRRDSSVQIGVEQFATVEPFYQAELQARVSGVVRRVRKDIGDRVRRDEVLVEIDVPELDREVNQKESLVFQRRKELKLAQAMLKDAEAAREVANTTVRLKRSGVREALATRDFRLGRLTRFRALEKKEAISVDLVEEQQRDFDASAAAVEGAEVAVDQARALLAEKESKFQAALTDIELKEASVQVALSDLERSRALAAYTQVTAPFDGVVVRRKVDPGSFVHNASTSHGEPLLTIARVDLVTVVTKVPDNAARFLTRDTEVSLLFDELPGVVIRGRATRFTPSIQASDRTIRVEVDLHNGSSQAFAKLVRNTIGAALSPLSGMALLEALTLQVAGQIRLDFDRKGPADLLPLPSFPLEDANRPVGARGSRPRLLPGMSGTIRVQLSDFADSWVIPSSAIYSRGGKPYVLLVEQGRTRQVPVQVQINDGKMARVGMLARLKDAAGGARNALQELTGQEEIVVSRQLEVGDNAEVECSRSDW